MCFSAPVSFTASIILIGIGSATFNLVKSHKAWPLLGFALTPFLFGLQQFIEGIVWLTINNPAQQSLLMWSKTGYLFFATVLWPIWVPLMFYIPEKEKRAQYVILFFVLLGVIYGIKDIEFLSYYKVNQYQFSLQYDYGFSPLSGWGRLLYSIIAFTPILFSSLRYAKIYLASLLIPLLSIVVIDANYMISLWCFLSALASSFLYVLIKNNLPAYSRIESEEKPKI